MSKYYDIEKAINDLNNTLKDKPRVSLTSVTFVLLGIAFIVLQLCGVIHWPWIWVVAPFWIPLAVALFLVTILLIFFIVVIACSKK